MSGPGLAGLVVHAIVALALASRTTFSFICKELYGPSKVPVSSRLVYTMTLVRAPRKCRLIRVRASQE